MSRSDGYAPIRDYAAIGDGRTIALVARDGSVDWLPLPTLVSPPALAGTARLRARRPVRAAAGRWFDVERRYVPETNVLETTFRTASGAARVTDAVTQRALGLLPWFELARRIEGLSGEMRFRWDLDVRFPFGGGERTHVELLTFGAEDGAVTVREGERALLALVAVEDGPLPRPERDEIDRRIDETAEAWRTWIRDHSYDGPWHDAVTRSALALKLLTYEPHGGIAAAATTSLPSGSAATRTGTTASAGCATRRTRSTRCSRSAGARTRTRRSRGCSTRSRRPRPTSVRCTGSAGGPDVAERIVDLDGYRGSRPVRTGNAAAKQTQLGVYGDLLDTAWRYVDEGNALDSSTQELLASVLDRLASTWRDPDCGFWEIRGGARHYTHSKLSAQIAFDRALRLAQKGELPNDDAPAWARELDEIQSFVESRCWSDALGAYRFYADEDRLDTTTLLAYRRRIPQRATERLESTIAAVRRELGAGGPLLYRHSEAVGQEGAFVARRSGSRTRSHARSVSTRPPR